jgi:DNA-binding MarR family transcriptional regulator
MTTRGSAIEPAAHSLVRVIPRLSRILERELSRSEAALSLRQLRVLQRLADGEQVAAAIARESSVGPAAMQGVLDGLVDRGLILRQRSTEDRRKQLLELTPGGRAALLAGNGLLTETLTRLLEGTSPDELTCVAAAMGLLQGAIDRYIARRRSAAGVT